MTTCKICKTDYEILPQTCQKCGFPFAGTEKEKTAFSVQQIIKKGHIEESKKHIKIARVILWIIGGFNLVSSFFYSEDSVTMITAIIIGLIFIGFGFYTYKKPFISILIPLSFLLLVHTIIAIIEPATIFQGLILKIIFLFLLIYALVSVMKTRKMMKESEFLKEQNDK